MTNNKSAQRKGKVQLINAVDFYNSMRKSLGDKRKYVTDLQIKEIASTYANFEETEHCKIYPNEFFGYTKVTVERPLIEKSEILGEKK